MEGKKSYLMEARIVTLEKIGFVWSVGQGSEIAN
jgi:hypothetical protein